MKRLLIALSITLLSTGSLRAQGPSPDEEELSSPSDPALRITVEALGAGAVTAAIWVGMVWKDDQLNREHDACVRESGERECFRDGLSPTMASLMLTGSVSAMSVYLLGELAGGDGDWWAPMLGAGIGKVGAGIAAAIAIREPFESRLTTGQAVAFSFAAALPLIGAIIGYEVSQTGKPEPPPPHAAWAAGAGPTDDAHGVALTLAGKF